MGEVGNLSQTEQDVYRQDLGMSGEIRAWKEWWKSVPDAERVGKIKQLVKTIEQNAAPKVLDAINRYAGAYSGLYKEVPAERIKEHFMSFGRSGAVTEAGMSDTDRFLEEAKQTGKKLQVIGIDDQPYNLTPQQVEEGKDKIKEVIGLMK
jgi:hypothetical protein